MYKKLLSLGLTVAVSLSLAACGTANKQTSTDSTKNNSSVNANPVGKVNLNPTTVSGVGPYGEKAVSPSALTLTDAEKQKLREGHFTAAFVYHMLDNEPNQIKLAAAKTTLEALGVKVVSVTDANFNAQHEISNIESTMSLKPDIMISMPVDPVATASAYREVEKAGTKLVFMENIPKGFKPGTDYVSLVNSDSYGNGKAAADMLAQQIGYKGDVGMVYYDAVFFTTNERDRGFRDEIKKYPDIKLVVQLPFTDQNNVGSIGDALFAKHPNIKGIYTSWDNPAQGIIPSAKSAGRNDFVMTTCDLTENTARMIADGGMIRGTSSTRSYDQGVGEAMAAAYALLGKQVPSYITPPALPVMKENVLDAYKLAYHKDAPAAVVQAFKKGK
jgi:ribose transport system substrate-binding protein